MKNNHGFGTLSIFIVIVAVLAIGGGGYYIRTKNDSKNDIDNQKYEDDLSKKNYKNVNAGYSIDYPVSWFLSESSDYSIQKAYNVINIQNMKVVDLSEGGWKLKNDGTQIQINVTYNIDYANYEELLKDPSYALSPNVVAERMANLEVIKIGGKPLQAFTGLKVPLSRFYSFIYNKKMYSIGISSGGEEQFNKDKKIFDDIVSSFVFLDTEESPLENFHNQPGAVKSVKVQGNQWLLEVDLLSQNPEWLPGVNEPYLNQNTKLRNLIVTKDTRAYVCGLGLDNNDTTPDVLQDTTNFMFNTQKAIDRTKLEIQYRGGQAELMTDWETLDFDISGPNITAIRNICLP